MTTTPLARALARTRASRLPKTFSIADLFCGAGGTSKGACEAAEELGYAPNLTAINHWPVAIETHTRNHPGARHLCTGIDSVNPRDLYAPGELQLLWASPECTHHSVARGGRPIHEQSRATAWCVIRWADALLPPVILVENVPEFVTWGPLDAKGRPIERRKGEIFHSWVKNLQALGYRVDWRVLCAADYGDPTTRRRLFVQCVRGRRKIVWPKPTHAPIAEDDLLGRRKRWVAAREIIDWELPSQSIYERKRPLTQKTMDRIYAGLRKFGLKGAIIQTAHGNDDRTGNERRAYDPDAPLGTVAASNDFALAQPFIVGAGGSEYAAKPQSVDAPMNTVTTENHRALVEPFIMSAGGPPCPPRPVSQPVGTVLTRDHRALVEPFLIPQHSGNPARSVEEPAPTVTTTSRGMGLAEPYLICMEHKGSVRDIDRPVPTITTAKGGAMGVAEPFLVQLNHEGGERVRSVETPLPTVCGNRGEFGVCEPALLPQGGGGELRPVSEPVPTVACAGAIGVVEPFLIEYYGNGMPNSVEEPLPTVTCKERHALVRPQVVIDGQRYLLDIRFRMLQPHELAQAQGFPKDYQFAGNKTEQVKQIGNAVPRHLARALVKAVLMQ